MQRKLYNQLYGTNLQRDLVVHLTNSNRKKYICDIELS